jgi:hypothetical protein
VQPRQPHRIAAIRLALAERFGIRAGATSPISRRPSFKTDMQPLVTLRQSLDRPLDRPRAVLDLAEKPHLAGPARFRDRHGVLFLHDVESDKKLRYAFPWSALRA